MKEVFSEINDSKLLEGLSHEPFVKETARWLIDERPELTYEPDLDRFYHYMDQVYGIGEYQAQHALGLAESRAWDEISNA